MVCIARATALDKPGTAVLREVICLVIFMKLYQVANENIVRSDYFCWSEAGVAYLWVASSTGCLTE